jgi:tetraacyldisaccharide 4'-kinase
MWQSLHDAWWRLATQSRPQSFSDALACRALQLGSIAYRAAVALRNAAYDRGWARPVRLPCRVVSVGNLTVGGTGKTACVELIADKLRGLSRCVAVLSRGYGGARRTYWLRWDGVRLLVNGRPVGAPVGEAADPEGTLRASCSGATPATGHAAAGTAAARGAVESAAAGDAWHAVPAEVATSAPAGGWAADGLADEPQLLAHRLAGTPILVGARRDRTGRMACETFGADTAILDDGFQHRRLARDCDIVLVHAATPLGGWAVLPRGPMREPMSALQRAHVIIVTKADAAWETLGALAERLRLVNPQAAIVTAVHEPRLLVEGLTGATAAPSRLAGLRVGLVSSIGDPEGFETTVRRLEASVLWHLARPDHHAYRPADWAAILRRVAVSRPEALVTTEKDWVRLHRVVAACERQPELPLWVLGIRMRVLNGEEALDARLAGLCARAIRQ